MGEAAVSAPTFSVEVITLPVTDVDRAMRFYVDQVGFKLDVDYAPTEAFRVVQLTPPGSSCSIQIGTGLTDASAGSVRNIHLVVTDLEAARGQLLGRGLEVGEIRHKTPEDGWDGGLRVWPRSCPTRLRKPRRLLGSRRQRLDLAGARISRGVTAAA
jgi:catechol 2,3-dioxygenase-like lactoylglutathione lyase family enzyme